MLKISFDSGIKRKIGVEQNLDNVNSVTFYPIIIKITAIHLVIELKLPIAEADMFFTKGYNLCRKLLHQETLPIPRTRNDSRKQNPL